MQSPWLCTFDTWEVLSSFYLVTSVYFLRGYFNRKIFGRKNLIKYKTHAQSICKAHKYTLLIVFIFLLISVTCFLDVLWAQVLVWEVLVKIKITLLNLLVSYYPLSFIFLNISWHVCAHACVCVYVLIYFLQKKTKKLLNVYLSSLWNPE